jgi:hypothetical protein
MIKSALNLLLILLLAIFTQACNTFFCNMSDFDKWMYWLRSKFEQYSHFKSYPRLTPHRVVIWFLWTNSFYGEERWQRYRKTYYLSFSYYLVHQPIQICTWHVDKSTGINNIVQISSSLSWFRVSSGHDSIRQPPNPHNTQK